MLQNTSNTDGNYTGIWNQDADNDATNAAIIFKNLSQSNSTSSMHFLTRASGAAAAERMVILDGGNVGIGVTAPNAKLQVGDSCKINTSLGVGTDASGTTGEIRATNNITAYYSDARLKDFEGTTDTIDTYEGSVSSAIVSGSDEVCLETNNREVHAGTGSASTDVPKWLGWIDFGQFGGSAPSNPVLENAELKHPININQDLYAPLRVFTGAGYNYPSTMSGYNTCRYRQVSR